MINEFSISYFDVIIHFLSSEYISEYWLKSYFYDISFLWIYKMLLEKINEIYIRVWEFYESFPAETRLTVYRRFAVARRAEADSSATAWEWLVELLL